MVKGELKKLSREDWLQCGFKVLIKKGVEGIKIVLLADQLGVTSGSFYWHFKNRKELCESLLDYWEQEMTDAAIEKAKQFAGPPKERIWNLMEQVMTSGLASYDLAIWHWAQSDPMAHKVFQRAVDKRFSFATWMFTEAGFSKSQAEARGRMMVVYMMGESTLITDTPTKRKAILKLKYNILINP